MNAPAERVASEGDERALEQIRPALRTFFQRRTPDRHEVDDLVQEVYVRLVRRGALGENDNLTAYAFRTAQSVLLDRARYQRARHSGHHVAFDPDLHAASGERIEDGLIAREMLADAVAALDRLPERTRRVLLLRRVDGLSMKDIADHLGISVSAVEKHMHKATQHMVKARRRSQ